MSEIVTDLLATIAKLPRFAEDELFISTDDKLEHTMLTLVRSLTYPGLWQVWQRGNPLPPRLFRNYGEAIEYLGKILGIEAVLRG